MANLPEMVKLVIDVEVINGCTHRIGRGGWRERVSKEQLRCPGAPSRGTESEVGALLWLMRETWWLRSDGTMESTAEPIIEDILTRHAGSPQLSVVPDSYFVLSKEKRAQVLAQLLESPHAEVRAAVHLRQAHGALRSNEPEAAEQLRANCASLLASYGDLPYHQTTYGEMARACLGRHSGDKLVIGQTVPEIQGEDMAALKEHFAELIEQQRANLVKDEFDQIYTEAGATGQNAGTTQDLTIYFIRVPRNKMELWLDTFPGILLVRR